MNTRGSVIVAGGGRVTPSMLKPLRGSVLGGADLRFVVVVVVSILAHSLFIWRLSVVELPPLEPVPLAQMPERFARLIVEKPVPREDPRAAVTGAEARAAAEQAKQERAEAAEPTPQARQMQRRQAVEAVEQRAASVEKKMRTVGVLGMLTGTGTTAKGPAVVDVLGPMASRRDKPQDLEKALAGMQGLQRAADVATAQQKLVKSKEVSLRQTESIDHLVASVTGAGSGSGPLERRGTFVIQKPESIEGAASASAKRDFNAINAIVSARRAGINMAYQERLRANPGLEGKVTIRFTITADGSVTGIEIMENTTGDADFVASLVRRVRFWRFESIPEGDVTVTYPFVFRPS